MTDDRAISLNAVLEKTYTLELKDMWQKTVLEEVVNVKDIMQLPPVTSSRPTGHWIDGKCDKCGNHAPYLAIAASTYFINYTDYCPNCGARMVEPQERSDKE